MEVSVRDNNGHFTIGSVPWNKGLTKNNDPRLDPTSKVNIAKATKEQLLKLLDRNSKAYDKNFELLLKSVGTSKHQKYLDIGEELDKIGNRIRWQLGPNYWQKQEAKYEEELCINL